MKTTIIKLSVFITCILSATISYSQEEKDKKWQYGVGIGKPMHKLDVCGTIRATVEIMVDASGAYCWPDFVFTPDYTLESFTERIETIKEQKHLPNVPSESQVAEEGIPVTETMRGILQNVEELYLYMEQMEQRIKQLEEENAWLRQIIE